MLLRQFQITLFIPYGIDLRVTRIFRICGFTCICPAECMFKLKGWKFSDHNVTHSE